MSPSPRSGDAMCLRGHPPPWALGTGTWRWWPAQRPHWRWQRGHRHLGMGEPLGTPPTGLIRGAKWGRFEGGGVVAGGPRPRGGGHRLCPTRGHRQQTGRGHSSALPWSRPGVGQRGRLPSPPPPSAAPPGQGGMGEGGGTPIDICASCTYIHAGGDPRHRPGSGEAAGGRGGKRGVQPGDGGAVGQCKGVPQPPAAPPTPN